MYNVVFGRHNCVIKYLVRRPLKVAPMPFKNFMTTGKVVTRRLVSKDTVFIQL